jgi:myo-inositol-1(or 4)-monophosphatase
MGAAALDLAYVAAGRFDAYWEYGLSSWDFAAGMLLVREAGGYVSDPENGGDPLASGNVLAANDHLHSPLQSMLAQAS